MLRSALIAAAIVAAPPEDQQQPQATLQMCVPLGPQQEAPDARESIPEQVDIT